MLYSAYTVAQAMEENMRKKRAIAMMLAGLLAVLAAAFLFAGNYFYEYSLKPRRGERAPGVTDSAMGPETEEARDRRKALEGWLDGLAQDEFLQSADGLKLHALRVPAQGHHYAIAVHGYTASARSMASFGKRFHDRGFTVLMPDLRGHGESEGHYIGMGWHDRLDMLRWIDRIVREDPEAKIILFGISMGAATVMMTAGEDLPPHVKLVIEDCGYTSVFDEFAVQLRAQFGLPPFPVMHAASLVTKLRAGYWLGEADAVRQVAKCRLPMLFIHGTDDTFVPFSMLETLYQAAGGEKEQLAIEGAGHGMASSADPERYWETVDAFLEKHL